VDLNTWNTTRDSGRREDTAVRARMAQIPCRPDKREKVDLDMMTLDTINLEEVGKDEGLATHEKVLEASAMAYSTDTLHSFWMGLFLEAISRRQ